MSRAPEPLCPLSHAPDVTACDPAELAPLVAWLSARATKVTESVTFPRGTVLVDQGGGRVDLCKQSIGPSGVSPIMGALRREQELFGVLLGTNAIGDEGARALASALTAGAPLRTVYLGCNRIGPSGAAALAEAIAANAEVRALWLKRNPLGPEGATPFARVIRAGCGLRTLDLVNTELGPRGTALIIEAILEGPTPIERIFLGGNGLGPAVAPLLAALVKGKASLRALYLAVNRLGDEGAVALAEAVFARGAFEALSLASNDVGPRAAPALGEATAVLRQLDLGGAPSTHALGERPNRLGDEGAAALAPGVARSSVLAGLDLRDAGITSRGVLALLPAIEASRSLVEVGLGKHVARSLKRKVAAFVARNRAAGAPLTHVAEDVCAVRSVYR